MEAASLGILISTLVGVIATFIVNVIQSIKEDHFQSECFGGKCCKMSNDFKGTGNSTTKQES
jgi:hypothetical protein